MTVKPIPLSDDEIFKFISFDARQHPELVRQAVAREVAQGVSLNTLYEYLLDTRSFSDEPSCWIPDAWERGETYYADSSR